MVVFYQKCADAGIWRDVAEVGVGEVKGAGHEEFVVHVQQVFV